VLNEPVAVGSTILAALEGKPRNQRSSRTPSRASLGGFASNSATLPARGRVNARAGDGAKKI
jgi:hypothetical protein